MTRIALLCLAAIALASCDDDGAPFSRAAPEVQAVAPPEAAGFADESAVSGQTLMLPAQMADSVPPSMIIRTGDVRVEVDSLEPAIAAVRTLAARNGGYVSDVMVQTGRNQLREARLQMRVPAPRFDAVITGLAPLGDVEAVNVTAQDVGAEYVDLQARMTNARRLEQRLLDLLATRTGELEDVLAVERELARVREEIERHEGRLRYLRNRVGMSTLTVDLHEPGPLIGAVPGENVILHSFKLAGRAFVTVIAALIVSLGVIIPLGLIAALGWLAFRRYRVWQARRRARGSSR